MSEYKLTDRAGFKYLLTQKPSLREVSQSLLRLLFKGRRTVSQPPEDLGRILLIRRNHLGDAVCVLSLIQGIKETYPDVVIDVVANSYNAEIFRRSDFVHQVFEVPDNWLTKRYGAFFHPTIRSLRRGKPYDLVMNASGSYSSKAACLALACPGKFRLGVSSNRRAFWDFVWDIHRTSDEFVEPHIVQRLGELFRAAGFKLESLPYPRLRAQSVKSLDNTVLLCPVVRRIESRWSDERWSHCANLLRDRGYQVQWLAHRPQGRNEEPQVAPQSVGALIDELARYTAVVCSEGGISHLAPATGAFSIVLSGKEIRESWRPWSGRAVLIEKPNDIQGIAPGQVADKVKKLNNEGSVTAAYRSDA
jgi:ADP-heptose:LPS heptosyltransferase